MNTAQRSFAAGEVAPALYARTDVQRYSVALRTCRNWIVNKQGGASTRPGTEFIAPVYDSTQVVRLIKFVFSITDTLVLEFGDHTLRFFRNGAPVMVGGSPYMVSTPYAASEVGALQYVQSADVMTLVHPNHPPHELQRHGSVSWSLTPIVFLPAIGTPQNVDKSGGETSGAFIPTDITLYQVTAVDLRTGEESLPSIGTTGNGPTYHPTEEHPVTLQWDPVAGAGSYRVFRLSEAIGVFAYVGETVQPSFVDVARPPDVGVQPPTDLAVFQGANNYPATVGYYQQRLVFARTNNAPQTVWCSRSALYHNFTTSTPIQDDDAIVFTLVSDEVDPVRHVLNLGKLIILTEGSEWLVEGDANGVLTPTAINPRIGAYNGSAALRPIKVDAHALYVEALGSAVRQLGFSSADRGATLAGADLTLYSTHLFAGFTIVDWDWQRVPHFIAWAVRSDGVLLGLTYIAEQEMLAWHRHDTAGTIENVCVVPEGNMHRVYLVVRRDVNGTLMRYIERMTPGLGPVAEACVLDSSLEYDGRNAGLLGTTMTVSGGVDWTEDELLTLTASGPVFSATDVGNEIVLHAEDGTVLRFALTTYVSATVMQGYAHMIVPEAMRGVPIAEWDHAIAVVQGLEHLGAVDVGVFADRFVVASPNNPQMDLVHVEAGVATLDRPYAHIRVGLPYLPDLETLDIDRGSGPSMKEQRMAVTKIGAMLELGRGLWAGGAPPTGDSPVNGLTEIKVRENESMSDPVAAVTGYEFVTIANTWNVHGRVFLRQIDPVPATVLALMPMGLLPMGG